MNFIIVTLLQIFIWSSSMYQIKAIMNGYLNKHFLMFKIFPGQLWSVLMLQPSLPPPSTLIRHSYKNKLFEYTLFYKNKFLIIISGILFNILLKIFLCSWCQAIRIHPIGWRTGAYSIKNIQEETSRGGAALRGGGGIQPQEVVRGCAGVRDRGNCS